MRIEWWQAFECRCLTRKKSSYDHSLFLSEKSRTVKLSHCYIMWIMPIIPYQSKHEDQLHCEHISFKLLPNSLWRHFWMWHLSFETVNWWVTSQLLSHDINKQSKIRLMTSFFLHSMIFRRDSSLGRHWKLSAYRRNTKVWTEPVIICTFAKLWKALHKSI